MNRSPGTIDLSSQTTGSAVEDLSSEAIKSSSYISYFFHSCIHAFILKPFIELLFYRI